MLKPQWVFPPSNHSRIKGFNDSGIATFSFDAYASLSREICQNSLDAGIQGKTVRVEFESFYMDKNDFPDRENLRKSLYLSREQTNLLRNERAPFNFFDNALKVIDQEKIPFLRISDYNTIGLTGSNKQFNTNWVNLVKSLGTNDKDAQAGGSYGIGKFATFVCSSLRTVFYSTLDINHESATQGISELVSYQIPGEDDFTQGTGYYGIEEKNSPINECISLQRGYKRNESGTDIYIAGFLEDEDWHVEIIKEILNNYFYAIYEGTLEVKVNDIVISKETLEDLIKKNSTSDNRKSKNTKLYYEVLTSKDTVWFHDDLVGHGQVKLGILLGKTEEYNRSIAMIRKPWMRIYDYRSTTLGSFVGVFIVVGDNLNKFLRKLENPTHDKWEPGRSKDRKAASRVLRRINNYINETVRNLYQTTDFEQEDIIGAEDLIPLIEEDDMGHKTTEELKNDYLTPVVSDVIIKEVPLKKLGRLKEADDSDYRKLERTEGALIDGEDIPIHDPETDIKIINPDKVKLGTIPKGVTDGEKQVFRYVQVKPTNLRFVCINKKEKRYRIYIKYPRKIENCKIEVAKLDDQNVKFPIQVLEASQDGKALIVENNTIFGVLIDENSILDIVIDTETYFGAEVRVYEISK